MKTKTTTTKTRFLFTFAIYYLIAPFASYSQKAWDSKPFEQKVFVENNGQFTFPFHQIDRQGSETYPKHLENRKILFATSMDQVDLFFLNNGLTYKHDELIQLSGEENEIAEKVQAIQEKDEAEEENINTKLISHYLSIEWLNSNPAVEIVHETPVSHYYTYGSFDKPSIKAQAYEKIVYKNLYPNIDVEYIFPKDSSGIKYTIILHPGANPSVIQMKYKNADRVSMDSDGNAIIESSFGTFIDHAPVSFYGNSRKPTRSLFAIHKDVVSFSLPDISTITEELIIDPWTSNPTFAGFNSAYDVNFDAQGNVYALGSYAPFKLVKYNSAGVLQWTYNMPIGMGQALGVVPYTYGDFAVDEINGSIYLTEGYQTAATGSRILKVTPAGNQVGGTFANNANLQEMWKIEYNRCNKQFVIAGGGHRTFQAGVLDTAAATVSAVNVLGAAGGDIYHDMALFAMDINTNTCFMATSRPGAGSTFNNFLYRSTIPALTTTQWGRTYHRFGEVRSVAYINGFATTNVSSKLVPSNAMNGMAVSPSWLYTYNADTLKRWNKTTGAYSAGIDINPAAAPIAGGDIQVRWGGLAVDECDNVYVGMGRTILKYNSSFTLLTTYNLTDTVYDIKLNATNTKLYACGKAFVTEIDVVPNPPPFVTFTNPTACSACDGTATVNTCINASGVTYSWNTVPVQTTQTATGLCPGTYIVTMTSNCIVNFTDTVTIIGFNAPTATFVSQTNVSCNGGNDGTATASVTGGTPPYNYSWSTSPVQTGLTATGLSAGTYTFTVTDSSGCTDTVIYTITEPTAITINIISTNVTCNGLCNGTATATGSNGTPGYSYSWNTNPVQAGATANGLCAGTYTVTVTDNNSCTNTASVIITEPPVLTSVINGTNVLCNGGNTGAATLSANGGTPAYSYSWTTTPAQTDSTATGLTAGTYTCTVTDANGCTSSASITITEPTAIAASISGSTNATCNGLCNGTATVAASGATPGYTYSWITNPVQNTAIATGLCAGTYTVTATDANGCTTTTTVIITEPQILTVTSVGTNVTCNGGNNGSATATANGGTSGYSYSWSTAPAQTGATASNLTAGTYTVTATDANGCTATSTVTIAQPTLVTGTIVSTNITCFGLCNGTATATGTGGTPGYTYTWSTSPVQNTAIASGLCAGTYTVTIIDNNACTNTASVTITQPLTLTSSIATSTNVRCNGSNTGSATIAANGGTTPYTYSWNTNPGQSQFVATGLAAGSYTCTVTDANGCTSSSSINIVEPTAIVLVTSFTPGPCDRSNTGNVVSTGGTGAYAYSWNTNPPQTTATVTGVPVGTYIVTVTDANGCSQTQSLTIVNTSITPTPGFTVDPTAASIMYDPVFNFTDNSTNGNTWLWDFGDGDSSPVQHPSHTYDKAGTYCITQYVTNMPVGCKDSIIRCVTLESDWAFYVPNAFTPNGNELNDAFGGKGYGLTKYKMLIFDRWGNLIFESNNINIGWNGKANGGSQIAQEDVYVYSIYIHDSKGVEHKYVGHFTLVK